jgi:hypothetical protein
LPSEAEAEDTHIILQHLLHTVLLEVVVAAKALLPAAASKLTMPLEHQDKDFTVVDQHKVLDQIPQVAVVEQVVQD